MSSQNAQLLAAELRKYVSDKSRAFIVVPVEMVREAIAILSAFPDDPPV